jgi:hypothetical protein
MHSSLTSRRHAHAPLRSIRRFCRMR